MVCIFHVDVKFSRAPVAEQVLMVAISCGISQAFCYSNTINIYNSPSKTEVIHRNFHYTVKTVIFSKFNTLASLLLTIVIGICS